MTASFNAVEQELINGFTGSIRPVRVSFTYGLSLTLVAILMVLLPLCYLGMAASIAWLWWWYASHGQQILSAAHGARSIFWLGVLYVAPLIVGGVLVLFLFKPLFARRGRHERPYSVNELRQPVLFAFVRKLCATVGAPVPARIDFTCDVNASASFRNGIWSMFGRDLVLTIGLPLVAGQNVRQFTGVLAHEFGHFAQGWAMRANYLIRVVNAWFARVVYARDALDEWLSEQAQSETHIAWTLTAYLTIFMVWLSRRVLWLLMMIGHALSSLLSRQMEFDADLHAVRTVGATNFSSALRELPVLAAAEHGAHVDLQRSWRERRLADDLPALIQANVAQIPDDVRTQIINHGMAHNADMYASHPSTRDRITSGEREKDPPRFPGRDGPASLLFRNFDALCRDVSLNWYKTQAGLPVQASHLVPTTSLVSAITSQDEAIKTAEGKIGKLWSATTFFALASEAEPIEDEEKASAELEECEENVLSIRIEKNFQQAGMIKATNVRPRLDEARSKRQRIRNRLARAARAIWPRMEAVPGSEAEQCRRVLKLLPQYQDLIDDVREQQIAISALFERGEGRQDDENFARHVVTAIKQQHTYLIRIRDIGSHENYSFATHANMTVSSHLVPELPDLNDPAEIMRACDQALHAIFALHRRIVATLANQMPDEAPPAMSISNSPFIE